MASSQYTSQSRSVLSEGGTFQSLDDVSTLCSMLRQAQSADAENFLVMFDDVRALIKSNSSSETLQRALRRSDSSSLATRWLCIFKPSQHKETLQWLAQQYDFAPRLLAEMCSSSMRQSVTDDLSFQSSAEGGLRSTHSSDYLYKPASNHTADSSDLEPLSSSYASTLLGRKNIYSLADEIWHYTTVDFGRNYMCCGYNTLYTVPSRLHKETSGLNQLPVSTFSLPFVLLT